MLFIVRRRVMIAFVHEVHFPEGNVFSLLYLFDVFLELTDLLVILVGSIVDDVVVILF